MKIQSILLSPCLILFSAPLLIPLQGASSLCGICSLSENPGSGDLSSGTPIPGCDSYLGATINPPSGWPGPPAADGSGVCFETEPIPDCVPSSPCLLNFAFEFLVVGDGCQTEENNASLDVTVTDANDRVIASTTTPLSSKDDGEDISGQSQVLCAHTITANALGPDGVNLYISFTCGACDG